MTSHQIEIGIGQLSFENCYLELANQPGICLTQLERDVLCMLFSKNGAPALPDELATVLNTNFQVATELDLQGRYPDFYPTTENSVLKAICHLREKLECTGLYGFIINDGKGRGYRFNPDKVQPLSFQLSAFLK